MSTEISPRIAAEIGRLRMNARELSDLPLTPDQRKQLRLAVEQLDALPKLYAESWLIQALWVPAGRIRAVARQCAASSTVDGNLRSA